MIYNIIHIKHFSKKYIYILYFMKKKTIKVTLSESIHNFPSGRKWTWSNEFERFGKLFKCCFYRVLGKKVSKLRNCSVAAAQTPSQRCVEYYVINGAIMCNSTECSLHHLFRRQTLKSILRPVSQLRRCTGINFYSSGVYCPSPDPSSKPLLNFVLIAVFEED